MTTVVSVTIQSQWDEAKCPTMEIQTRQELLLDEYDTTKDGWLNERILGETNSHA